MKPIKPATQVLALLLASTALALGQGPGPTAATPKAADAVSGRRSSEASLLVSADATYAWTLDGDLQGMTSSDMHPKRVAIPKPGAHEIVITSPDGSIKVRKDFTVKAGEQTVVHFTATSIEVNGGSIEGRTLPTVADEEAFRKRVDEMQAQGELDHPEQFARVTPASAYKGLPQAPGKWLVNVMVVASGVYYQPKLQMTVKSAGGKWIALPDGQPGITPAVYQIQADDLGTEAAVCYTAKSDRFPTPMRLTGWYTVQPGAVAPGRQMTFINARPATLTPASDAPCGGKPISAVERAAPAGAPAATATSENPMFFGSIDSSISRYGNKWRVILIAEPFRLGTTYYDEKVELTLKGVAGRSGPVHVTNLQPGPQPSIHEVLIGDLGREAVVCYTAKDATHPTPMRLTGWYKVNTGDSAANFTPTREPTLTPASDAPCE